MADRLTERQFVACPVITASQRFSGIGKAVHEIREEQVELHHHRIDRKNHCPMTGTSGCKEEVHQNQAQCTEEDVTVDMEETAHRRADERALQNQITAQTTVVTEEQTYRNEEARILCDDRSKGHSLDLHAKSIDQQQTHQDVDHVLSDGDQHGNTGVLHADIPTRQTEQSQRGRSAPDHDVEIGGGRWLHVGCRTDQPEHHEPQWHLEDQQDKGNTQGDGHRA